MSRKVSFRLFLVPVLALVALAGITGAAASPPSPASGTFAARNGTFNSVRFAGGNVIIDLSAEEDYTGTLSGTATLHGTLVHHAYGDADFQGIEVFTGTVDGVPGTLTFNVSARTDAGGWRAMEVILSGSDGLANLHGVLTEDGTLPPRMGTYTGELHTAP